MGFMCISNARPFVASAQKYHRQKFSYGHLATQMVKNPPATQETWVQFLGLEDPLEKGMATTPVFLPGETHGQRSLAGYSP